MKYNDMNTTTQLEKVEKLKKRPTFAIVFLFSVMQILSAPNSSLLAAEPYSWQTVQTEQSFDPNASTQDQIYTRPIDDQNAGPLSPATPAVISPSSNLTAQNITTLPRYTTASGVVLPQATSLAPQGATASATLTPENLKISYNTAAAGWAGGGYAFDHFGDAAVQTANLGGLASLIVGLTGNVSQVKLEAVSYANGYEQKNFVYLKGIRSDVQQFWQIPTSNFAGVDWTHVRVLYFIIEGSYLQGELRAKFNFSPITISPSTRTLQEINIPGNPGIARVAATGDSSSATATSRGLVLNYNTTRYGWTGAGFADDDFSTPGVVEYKDLSGLSDLVYGVQGDTPSAKVEFIDASGRKVYVHFNGISSKEQVYAIPTATLSGLGLDTSKVSITYFIMEAAGQIGKLIINRLPPQLNTVILPSSNLKSQDISVPGNTWAAHVAPADDHISRTIATPYGVDFSYSTQYKWAGTGFSWDDFSTPDVGSANLSGLNLRFGIRGDTAYTAKVMFEAIDALGNKVTGLELAGIRSDIEQVYEISMATLTSLNPNFDPSQFRIAYFIVVTDTWKEGNLIINKVPPKPESTTPLEQPFTTECSGEKNISTEQAYQYCLGTITTLVGTVVKKIEIYFSYQRGNTGVLVYNPETKTENRYSVPGLGFLHPDDPAYDPQHPYQPVMSVTPDGKFVIFHHEINRLSTISTSDVRSEPDVDYLPTTAELSSLVFYTNTSGRIVTQRGEEFLFTIDPSSGELTFYPV